MQRERHETVIMLCILTSKQVLRMPFAGRNQLFLQLNNNKKEVKNYAPKPDPYPPKQRADLGTHKASTLTQTFCYMYDKTL